MSVETEKKIDELINKLKILEDRIAELESTVYAINWVLIEKYHRFFNEYLSTFYDFKEQELINFHEHLVIGHEFSEPCYEMEPLGVGQAEYGLSYNKNITWNDKLVQLFDNIGWVRVKAESYPFDILKQVKSHFYFEDLQYNYWHFRLDMAATLVSSENEYFYDLSENIAFLAQIDFVCNVEIHRRYNRKLNKSDFSRRDVILIIEEGDTDYFCNNEFINMFKKMLAEVKDFNLHSFYRLKANS